MRSASAPTKSIVDSPTSIRRKSRARLWSIEGVRGNHPKGFPGLFFFCQTFSFWRSKKKMPSVSPFPEKGKKRMGSKTRSTTVCRASKKPFFLSGYAPFRRRPINQNDILPDPPNAAPRHNIVAVTSEQSQKPARPRNDHRRHAPCLQLDAAVADIAQPRSLADMDDLLVADFRKPFHHTPRPLFVYPMHGRPAL